jgi:D-glycero-alpha-D-manno-heptose-7-phosphate kinase
MNELLVVKAPLRISLVGGGTDIKNFYTKEEGSVFSAAINKYVYIIIKKYHDQSKCILKYSSSENVKNLNEIKHPLIRNCLRTTQVWGVDIHSIADIPGGTGLGSSSSFTVALLHALNTYKGQNLSKPILANKACHVEINLCKAPIGKQDQYAASFGGINTFNFKKNGNVTVKKFINKKAIKSLHNNLILINTGIIKKNELILKDQIKNISKGGKYFSNLELINNSVEVFKKSLIKNDIKLCGEILDENWKRKITLSKMIRNQLIDEIYHESMVAGAYGGKVCGAGGRGFLMLLCPKSKQKLLKRKFSKLEFLNFNFDFEGSKLLKLS